MWLQSRTIDQQSSKTQTRVVLPKRAASSFSAVLTVVKEKQSVKKSSEATINVSGTNINSTFDWNVYIQL